MIQTFVPFRSDKNLGRAYNEAMDLLRADEWACFWDHDCMPTTPRWHDQFCEAIKFLPDAGVFVAMANRIGPSWQRCGPAGDDVREHRRFGAERLSVRTLLDVTETKGWGGVMFALNKETWLEAGGFAEGAMFCVDHSIHFRLQSAGRRSYVIEGLYAYHVRASSESALKAPYVEGCPCRGAEQAPTERVALP